MEIKTSYILNSGLMLILFAIYSVAFYRLYKDDQGLLLEKMRHLLDNSVEQLGYQVMDCGPADSDLVSSYNNTVIISKNNIEYDFDFKDLSELKVAHNSALYDLRHANLWTLERLDSIFSSLKTEAVNYLFILQDSTGKRLGILKKGLRKIPAGPEDAFLLLGLLEKHQLKAYFELPVTNFLEKEWLMVFYFLVSVIMLSGGTYWLASLLRRERKLRENEELNVQMINHDLKSPVNLIKMNLELMETGGVDRFTTEQQQNFRIVKEKTQCLDILIRRIAAKWVNEKGLLMNDGEFDLYALLQQIVKAVREEQNNSKKVNITMDCRLMENSYMYGDRIQIGRALKNLIENAIKYSGENVRIRIRLIRLKRKIIVSVEDNGIGIDAQDIDHIFEAGFRSKNIVESIDGSGLGLNFVQMVAHAHQGKVEYRKGTEKGNIFFMILKTKKNGRAHSLIVRR